MMSQARVYLIVIIEHYTTQDPEGEFGDLSPLNFCKSKLFNVKVNGNKRLALKFSQEIRTETLISNINLWKTENTDLRGNFSKRSVRRLVYIILI